ASDATRAPARRSTFRPARPSASSPAKSCSPSSKALADSSRGASPGCFNRKLLCFARVSFIIQLDDVRPTTADLLHLRSSRVSAGVRSLFSQAETVLAAHSAAVVDHCHDVDRWC